MDCSMVQMVVNHGRGEGLWDTVWCKHIRWIMDAESLPSLPLSRYALLRRHQAMSEIKIASSI